MNENNKALIKFFLLVCIKIKTTSSIKYFIFKGYYQAKTLSKCHRYQTTKYQISRYKPKNLK